MLENEEMQFYLHPSPKAQVKNEETRKKDQNFCIICQKKGNNLVSATENGENTFLIYVSWDKNDVCSCFEDSRILEEKNVTLRYHRSCNQKLYK